MEAAGGLGRRKVDTACDHSGSPQPYWSPPREYVIPHRRLSARPIGPRGAVQVPTIMTNNRFSGLQFETLKHPYRRASFVQIDLVSLTVDGAGAQNVDFTQGSTKTAANCRGDVRRERSGLDPKLQACSGTYVVGLGILETDCLIWKAPSDISQR